MQGIQFGDALGIHYEVRFLAAGAELHQQVRATGKQTRALMRRQQYDDLGHRHRRGIIKPFHNESLPWITGSEAN
jgi:hypothetical protein